MRRALAYLAPIAVIIVAVAVAKAHAAPPAPCATSCTLHEASPMPGMSMGGMDGAASMGGMDAHMKLTQKRPARTGDAQRAAQIVATLRASIGKYQDYRAAEQDGYMPFHAEIPQRQYHFTNWRNAAANIFSFDPSRPTSLLYEKTGGGYRLIGAMYTAPRSATPDDLDARVPLSIAQWHEHVDFCKGPAGTPMADYVGPNARFGLAGSIATADACAAAGGTFIPLVYNWMVHVYPFETDPSQVWRVE